MHSICRMCIALSDRGNETSIKICSVLAANNVMSQYNIPVEVGKHQTTVLRQLRKLEKQGIVELVRTEKSAKKGKDRKIFALTFKGMLGYLATFKKKPEKIVGILERNGKRLQYPLFQHVKTLANQLDWNISSFFIICANNLLGNPRMVQLEHWSQALGESKLESAASNIETLHQMEDQFLRDVFFLTVLECYNLRTKVPNQELHSYIEQLLRRKTEQFNSTKSLLEAGLTLFGPNNSNVTKSLPTNSTEILPTTSTKSLMGLSAAERDI